MFIHYERLPEMFQSMDEEGEEGNEEAEEAGMGLEAQPEEPLAVGVEEEEASGMIADGAAWAPWNDAEMSRMGLEFMPAHGPDLDPIPDSTPSPFPDLDPAYTPGPTLHPATAMGGSPDVYLNPTLISV